MNWTWIIRARDAAMNGLEFACCTTAGGFTRVLIHAAPAHASVELTGDDGRRLARSDVDREGDYSPMTLLELDGERFRRREIWPDETHHGLPVLLAGGEVGILRQWRHSDDHSWWQWSVEFSNHTGRPADWSPPDQDIQR
jgi:hypothetical protein